jgi:filamentation induced by cAMP protein fic
MSSPIESPPRVPLSELTHTLSSDKEAELRELIDKANTEYLYWSKVKYAAIQPPLTPRLLWGYIQEARRAASISIWRRYGITLYTTPYMQGVLYELENLRSEKLLSDLIPATSKKQYLLRSIEEEAIRSSQMEGASTTRRVAKEMLQQGVKPRNRSERMISNNYRALQFIKEHQDSPMTEELLLELHRTVVRDTLERKEDEGRLRTSDDDVVVENGITKEVVHTPPPAEELAEFVGDLCKFCNDTHPSTFIHPILRAVIIHFMIAYMHPFVDGNGRTARALFYWLLIRSGYSLIEYISISERIYKSKRQYEEAFLQVEADELDLGYFAQYHLRILLGAIESFRAYAKRKIQEMTQGTAMLRLGGLNERQASILQLYQQEADLALTGREVERRFGVTLATAKSDLKGLVERGFLQEIALNKIKRAYLRSNDFDRLVAEASPSN